MSSEKILPKTSACSPYDYERVFGRILEKDPNAHIIHLGYSAATTSSFQSARSAAEKTGRVTCVDTCFASGGYGLIAGKIAHAVRSNPKMSAESAVGIGRVTCVKFSDTEYRDNLCGHL